MNPPVATVTAHSGTNRVEVLVSYLERDGVPLPATARIAAFLPVDKDGMPV